MVYTNKILAKIGKEVLHKHPDIATCIINEIQRPQLTDLSQIPVFFQIYCEQYRLDMAILRGPVYISALTEAKKIFLSAIIELYGQPYKLKKQINWVLGQSRMQTNRMIEEVSFRYKKDSDFTQKVDAVISIIILKPRVN